MIKKILLVFLVLFGIGKSFAQQVDLLEVSNSDYQELDGNFYLVVNKYDKTTKENVLTLYCYNTAFALQYEKNIEVNGKLGEGASMSTFNKHLLLRTSISNKPYFLLINPKTGAIESTVQNDGLTAYTTYSFSRDYEDTRLVQLWDKDTGKRKLAPGFQVRDSSLKVIYSGIVEFPVQVSGNFLPSPTLYKDYLLFTIKETKNTYKEQNYFYVYNMANNSISELSFNLPDDYGIIINYRIVKKSPEGLTIVAVVDENGATKGHKGIVVVKLDSQLKLSEKKYYPFTEEFKESYKIDKVNSYLAYLTLNEAALDKDNNIYVVMGREIQDHRGDISVLKIKQDVGYDWTYKIKRSQTCDNPDHASYMGLIAHIDGNGNTYLYYCDHPKNKTVFENRPITVTSASGDVELREVIIDTKGSVETKFIGTSYMADKNCIFAPYKIKFNNNFVFFYKDYINYNKVNPERKRHFSYVYYKR